jgi:methylthioribose-1-phosphate isomerase
VAHPLWERLARWVSPWRGSRPGDDNWDAARLETEIDRIRDARPTAVNLAWGVNQVRGSVPSGTAKVLGLDVAIIGADRIAANGDTANKVGSVSLALACQRAGIPFVVAAPSSTVDLTIGRGERIVIEERHEDEVPCLAGVRTAPAAVRGFNPALDVTPQDLISIAVTERGVAETRVSPRGSSSPHPPVHTSGIRRRGGARTTQEPSRTDLSGANRSSPFGICQVVKSNDCAVRRCWFERR